MENNRPKVSIIIPHYNQIECLKRLLPSIANQTFEDYEVIIIDDATPDRSAVEHITTFIKDHRKMRLVQNAENMRFIRTCNKGIGLAKGEYICLLNSDTEMKGNFIERNVEILDADGSIGGLSCILVDQEGKNWFTGGSFKRGLPVNLTDDFEGIRAVDFVAGTAPFYRREVFDRIGFFDENYHMYHEDVEFGLRLRAETNYKACMFPEKLVVHFLVSSIPKPEVYYFRYRNYMLLLRKYNPTHLPVMFLYILLAIISLLTFRLSRRSLDYVTYTIKGTLHGLVSRQSE